MYSPKLEMVAIIIKNEIVDENMMINWIGYFKVRVFYIGFFVAIFMLSGCSGESSSDSNGPVESSLENPNENSNDDDPEEVDDSNNDEFTYSREEDYPNIVKLPLEFFSTVNGKKIGVSVTLPANEAGEPIDDVFPTLLIQTAYNMSLVSTPSSSGALSGGADPFLVKRGYAMVTVDVLGSGVSEGGWELLGEEEQNGSIYIKILEKEQALKQRAWFGKGRVQAQTES